MQTTEKEASPLYDPKGIDRFIQTIVGFPKEGVRYRDITGILDSAEGFKLTIDGLCELLDGIKVDKIAAPESRGFIFGAPLAYKLGCALVPIRKTGKLPRETVTESYSLEYGTASVSMHVDAISPGDNVVIVDDLMATGGTALACAHLIERLGGKVVKILSPVELLGFGAKNGPLKGYDVDSLVKYPDK